MRELSVGFIGAGGIARAHAKPLREMGNIKFVGFCDIVEEKAKSYCNEYGGRPYTDFVEMYDKEKMDAVYICLPPFAHSNEVELAAERGIHIFIQKPIALDLKLADRMVRSVQKAGVKSQVGYQLRFGKGVQKAKKLLDAGLLGTITMATAKYICNFLGGAWWRKISLGGGQIVEQSTHAVDLLRYLCGDIVRVHSEMDRRYWTEVEDLEIEDVSSTAIRFASGAVGSMMATTGGYPGKWIVDLSIFTKKAVLDLQDPHSLRITWNEDGSREEYHSQVVDLNRVEAEHFIQAILNDTQTITPISDAAKTLAVTLAIRESGLSKLTKQIG